MKIRVLSALALLLATASVRADPPGVLERIERPGAKVNRDGAGRATVIVLPDATDDDLAGLCELPALDTLALVRARVTDDGLRTLAGLRQVRRLYLIGGVGVTDEGLRHLETMLGLRQLDLRDCPNFTPEGVARLRKALPDCTVNFR